MAVVFGVVSEKRVCQNFGNYKFATSRFIIYGRFERLNGTSKNDPKYTGKLFLAINCEQI